MKPSEAAQRAGDYIENHGDERARRCAAALLGRAEVVAALELLRPDAADVISLRECLCVCGDLRALTGERVRGWAAAVHAAQSADGGWAPGLPLEERLFETGMLAGELAKAHYTRPDTLAAAGDFLAEHWSADRVRGGSWSAIAAYAHYFANADHDAADGILQWCGRELGRAFLTRHFDAVRTVRVLIYCDAHGLPGAELQREDLILALQTEQAPDGSFPPWSGEGARDTVESTLDGLLGLQRLGA